MDNIVYNVGQLRKIIAETIDGYKPVIGKDVEKDDKKNNKDAYSEIEKQVKDYDGGLTDTDEIKTEETKYSEASDIDGLGMERLKYDNVNKPFIDKVKAQVMGKASTLQKDVEEESADSVSTKGNEKFLDKSEKMNKFDNDHLGLGGKDQSIVQLGTDITFGSGKPAKKDNAFENIKTNENKMKKLIFKKHTFISENHMISLIPEEYKVHGNQFVMKDSLNTEYVVEWNDKTSKANILEYKNPSKVNEDINKMKHLWGFKSSDTNKPLNSQQKVNENNYLSGFINKVKDLEKK